MIYCIDVGSTTTKLLELSVSKNKINEILLEKRHPTTVEHPYNDVTIAIENLCKENRIDINPSNFYVTSSAGGGLKILVIALTSSISGDSASRAVEVSGGVIIEKITLDDPPKQITKIEKIIKSNPDLILFIGGVEGGLVSKIIELSYLLKNSKPRNYLTDEKIPLIFAGNSKAFNYVKKILKEDYSIYYSENIRPSIIKENLGSVKQIIQSLFTNHVMKLAPGFNKIRNFTKNNIMPTPLAVEEYLLNVYKEENLNILAIDLGGATTDVFSICNKVLKRTVVANLGMSYNVNNILTEKDLPFINKFFGYDINIENLMNFIGNKYANPTVLPKNDVEKKYEMILASMAIRRSINLHFKNYLKPVNKYKAIFYANELEVVKNLEKFSLRDITDIILSGGIFTSLNKEDTMKIIDSALTINKELKIYKDNYFILPHLGNLLKNSDYDIKHISKSNIEFCGNIKDNKNKIFVIKNYDKNYILLNEKNRKELDIFENKFKIFKTKWNCNKYMSGTFLNNLINLSLEGNEKLDTVMLDLGKRIFNDHEFLVRIPYPYKIKMNSNIKLNKNDILASVPKKTIEVFTKFIYKKESERIIYIKNDGDEFNYNDIIYYKIMIDNFGIQVRKNFFFNYSGKIIKIDNDKNVLILSRRIENYLNKKTIIPNHKYVDFKKSITVREGEIIYKGTRIASENDNNFVSNISGVVKFIDLNSQKIILESINKYPDILAQIEGTVSDVNENKITIKISGTIIQGLIGFGNPIIGKVIDYKENINNINSNILFIDKILSFSKIKEIIDKKVKGLIFSIIPYSAFQKLKNYRVNVIILNGFSSSKLKSNNDNYSLNNKIVYFNPETSIRANLKRPFLFEIKEN